MDEQKKTCIHEMEITVKLGLFETGDPKAEGAAGKEMACLLRCACLLLTAIQPFRKGGGLVAAMGNSIEPKKIIRIDGVTSEETLEGIKTEAYKQLLEEPEFFQQLAAACRAVEELKNGV
ncbi:MAG: hypothetical protein Q4D62_08025 [Planctomycetia bacterium]|nr:hypothetical protein [Planctomycetia bacterium]